MDGLRCYNARVPASPQNVTLQSGPIHRAFLGGVANAQDATTGAEQSGEKSGSIEADGESR